jgi:hypothetical protein
MPLSSALSGASSLLTSSSPFGRELSGDITQNTHDLTNLVESRYAWAGIEGERWSKAYPYQLAILESQSRGYTVYQDTVFTLPIPPEELQINTPFATSLSATLGGIIRQPSGAPFRTISCHGSFGVLPLRPTANHLGEAWTDQLGAIGGIFGGTINGAQRTVSAAQSVVVGPEFTPNIIQDQDIDLNGTGYHQFRQLQRFLESYTEICTIQKGKNLRLALLIWKDQAGYIVEPVNFTVTKSVSSPHEYRYSLQFQAWKRIDPASLGYSGTTDSIGPTSDKRKASALQDAFRRVDSARRTLQEARNTVLAIRSDFDSTVGEGLRQSSLLLKDAIGLVKTAWDLPMQMRADLTDTADRWWDSVKSSINNSDPSRRTILDNVSSRVQEAKNGQRNKNDPDPYGLAKVLSDEGNSWLADSVKPSSIVITPSAQDSIDQELDRVKQLSRDDFRQMEQTARTFAADYADRVGLGNAQYNLTYGLSTAIATKQPEDDDYDVVTALSDSIKAFGALATYSEVYQPKPQTTIEYIAGAANAAGIEMRIPRSKFAVPFCYGQTLEQLAQQYLEDAQRWHEIAALNDLRAPYIDEVGSEQPLLVPGRGNEVVVSDASRVIMRQQVTLYSPTDPSIPKDVRRVVGVKKIAPSYWVMTLDGTTDLNSYTPHNGVVVHTFDPYTVHGQQIIYIPSDSPSGVQDNTQYVPTQTDIQQLLDVGYVDGALSDSGDAVIGSDGDWKLAWGLQGIIQWTRAALSTPKGSMSLHPEFGLPAVVGQSIADFSAKEVLSSLQEIFRNNSAFTGIRSASVEQAGPVAKINIELEVRGAEVLIPVSFNVPR